MAVKPDTIRDRLMEITLEMENIEQDNTAHALDGPIQNIINELDYAVGIAEELEAPAHQREESGRDG